MRNRFEVLGQISVNHFGVPSSIAKWTAHATGFRNHHASDRLRCVASGPSLLSQFAEPALHPVDLDARTRFPVHTWRSAIRPAERECVCEDVVTPHLVIQKMEPPRRLLLGLHVQRSLERPDSFGSCQAHANPPLLSSSKRTSNQGPFPPPKLPGFISTMSPSDSCRARLPMEPLPGSPDSPTGLPCCESPRVYVPRPLPRRAGRPSLVGRTGRPRRPSSIERRLGARIQPFEACSGFTHVAAHTLAGPPEADLCPRSFDGSVTLAYRPGSYQGVPTPPRTGLSPAALIHLSRRTLTDYWHRGPLNFMASSRRDRGCRSTRNRNMSRSPSITLRL